MMIRQGVAKQDRVAVKNALQLAYQLKTPIEPPILEMLKKWLGEEAFNAAMGKAPPPAPAPAEPPAATAKAPPGGAPAPPLVLIREGVAAQNKDAVRAALRTAVQQDTQIDAPVLEMLRKWLGEDDEALNTLAGRRGINLEPVIAQSTGKAPPTAPPSAPKPLAPGLVPQPEVPGSPPSKAAPAAPAAPAKAKAAPKVVPPRAPKAVPQEPVIRRGPVLKNAEPQPPPDLDASFDAFLQELDTPDEPAEKEPKRQKVEADASPSPTAKEDKEAPKPVEASPSPSRPSAPAPPRPGEIKRPAMRKPPEPKITKDEWGRDVVSETQEQEKEAWQYLQEARAAAKTSVWGAGNFIDFDNFK